MTKFLLTLSALSVIATPAFAVARDPRPEPSAPATANADAATITPPAKARRYCIMETSTGTRIDRKVCHTEAEWKALGVDLPAK